VDSAPSNPQPPIRLQGKLLISDPSLRDGVFNRSVVLLTHHSADEGAAGMIINHPTGKVVGDFLKGPEFIGLQNLAVHQGGPVLHDQLTFSSFWWSRKLGLRWSLRMSAQDAADHAHKPDRIVRAFLGYSGWTPGQLEDELGRNAWFPLGPQPDLLGREHDLLLWKSLLGGISPFHSILAEAPQDPLLN
jgi:putative transcriptional regulator